MPSTWQWHRGRAFVEPPVSQPERSQIWEIAQLYEPSIASDARRHLPGSPERPDNPEDTKRWAHAALEWATQYSLPHLFSPQARPLGSPSWVTIPSLRTASPDEVASALALAYMRHADLALELVVRNFVLLGSIHERHQLMIDAEHVRAIAMIHRAAIDYREHRYPQALARVANVSVLDPDIGHSLLGTLLR